jgi:hypothetical protein
MIRRVWVCALALGVSLACAAAPGRADTAADTTAAPLAVVLGPGSSLWLEGTSTLHDFESKTTELTVTLSGGPGAAAPADAQGLAALVRGAGVHGVEVAVPVRSLHSGKNGLDKNLWKDLKADDYPAIRFHLARYTAQPGAGDSLGLHAEGTLEIAGQSRPVTLEARAWRTPEGLWLEGSEALLMSQYGIRPPTMMMGTVRVGDRITVHYRLLLAPRGATGSASAKSAAEAGAHR